MPKVSLEDIAREVLVNFTHRVRDEGPTQEASKAEHNAYLKHLRSAIEKFSGCACELSLETHPYAEIQYRATIQAPEGVTSALFWPREGEQCT